jgi:hypothetical protein
MGEPMTFHILTEDGDVYCGASQNVDPAIIRGAEIAQDDDLCSTCLAEWYDDHPGELFSIIEATPCR